MRFIYLLCSLLFISSTAQAKEAWDTANASGKAIGIDFIICKSKGDFLGCFGIGCRGTSYELFSIRSGSGPYEGKTTIQLSDGTSPAVFKADPKGLDVFKVAMSRASVSKSLIQSIATSKDIKINDSGVIDTFSSASLLPLMKRQNNSCNLSF